MHDPWSTVLDARLLWTKRDDDADGKYEKAFGELDSGSKEYVLAKTWSERAVLESLFATVAHSVVDDAISREVAGIKSKQKQGIALNSTEESVLSFFPRGLFHLVALIGLRHRNVATAQLHKLLREPKELRETLMNDYEWSKAIFATSYEPCRESMRPLQALRSKEVWDRCEKLASLTARS
jgi:hypothetical protein